MWTKAQQKEYQREWAKRNKKHLNEYCRKWMTENRARWRIATMMFLGGKCEHCENNDRRVLQIDHVNGGGGKEIKTLKGSWGQPKKLKEIMLSILSGENRYQLLCSNCNWIKRFEQEGALLP
jgi:hypothetical protein